jgi:signal transduction histidine kinase
MVCDYGGSVSFERDMSYPLHGRRPRPPLTQRMRPGHWMTIDFVVGALAGLSGSLAAGHDVVTLASRLLLAAVIAVPVGLRRRQPRPAFGALVILAVIVTAVGLAAPADPVLFLAAAYVLYIVTVRGRTRASLGALMVALTVILVTQILIRVHQLPADRGQSSLLAAVALVIAWMTGYSVRQRRLYAQMLRHEAASSAVAGERLRIARELHDVVAHSMSVIAVQAGYGQYVIDTSPASAREALGAIQATSTDALEEMRRMLGLLRQHEQQNTAAGREPSRSAPLAPAPGLGDLDRLIERTRAAGLAVAVGRSGPVRMVPAGVDLSAYRIIQEALTNVVKHAGSGARCTVSLGYENKVLQVRIADDGGLPLVPAAGVPAETGSGHGLTGMRERAHLCGGEFTAGPLADGGFQVTAMLPLPAGPVGAS